MNLKQPKLSNWFKRSANNKQDSSSDSEDASEYVSSKDKAMYPTPMAWTRVKDIKAAVNQRVTIFDVEEDLNADKTLKQIRKSAV
jgi:hypothetical protein